ncbi:MAG: TlpA family protein disulfide reductase [Actinomycetota bacterium]|nr:MAG: TlpA family protein disulfide reductase [Actinomycetota bacterium]
MTARPGRSRVDVGPRRSRVGLGPRRGGATVGLRRGRSWAARVGAAAVVAGCLVVVAGCGAGPVDARAAAGSRLTPSPAGSSADPGRSVPDPADDAQTNQLRAASALRPCPTGPVTSGPAASGTAASGPAASGSAGGVPAAAGSAAAGPAGGVLPAVTLPCLGRGGAVELAALRGTPLVVTLWNSSCGPCRAELPLFDGFAQATGSRLVVLGINADEPAGDGLSYAASLGLTFPSLSDPDNVTRPLLGWIGLPVTYFYRSDGSLAGQHIGEITDRAMLASLVARQLGVSVPA